MDNITTSEYRQLIETKRLRFEDIYSNSNSKQNNSLLTASLDLIITTAMKMSFYSIEPTMVDYAIFEEIKNLSNEELRDIADESFTLGAISIIRYVIAQMFIENKIDTADKLKNTVEELKDAFVNKNLEVFKPYIAPHFDKISNFINNYSKSNPFQSWGPLYRYLLPFVYDSKLRNSIWHAIEIIKDNILRNLNIQSSWESKNSQGWYNKVRSYFGFEGPSNYGSTRAAIMLHPKNIPDHKNSIQLVCYFSQDKVWVGCDIGVNLENKVTDFHKELSEIDFSNCCGSKFNNDGIFRKFVQVTKILESNLDYAKEQNDKILNKFPEFGTEEFAEGDAETDDSGKNLYDPYIDAQADKINQLPIIDANEKIRKTIYPNIRPDEDFLERKDLAEYLAQQIIMNKDVEPLNIGIYGDWGKGKTQFINLLKIELTKSASKTKEKKKGYQCELIDFDAWQYDDLEHIWASLIMVILKKAMKHNSFYIRFIGYKLVVYLKEHWKEILLKCIFLYSLLLYLQCANQFLQIKMLTNILNFNMWLKSFGILLLSISPDLFQLGFLNIDKTFLEGFNAPQYNKQLGFRNKIKELISYALNFLSKKGKKRVILFIDNLDRCSSSNIKLIIDSISQFLEISKTDDINANLVTIFAIDKSILFNALKQQNIPEEKIYEYLDKIINLPVHLEMPKEINSLIDRFFGEEQNRAKDYLIEHYKQQPYNPRILANIRYLDHMIYTVYDEFLEDADKYIDLFKLRLGNDISWVSLTKNEINYKLESDLKDINRDKNDNQRLTLNSYMNLEKHAFNYLEQEFCCNINRHVRIKCGNKTFEFDGLAHLEKKDILFEIKYAGNYKPRDAFNRGAQQLLRYSNNINSKKNLELVLVLLADTDIKDKNALQMDLNKEFRRKLITTENSGQVLIIDANDLKTIQHEKSSTVYEHKN